MTDPAEVIARAMADALLAVVGGIRIGNVVHSSIPGIDADALASVALSALEGEGMVVVPVEPTLPMLAAGDSALCSALECTCQEGTIYRAMVVRRPR